MKTNCKGEIELFRAILSTAFKDLDHPSCIIREEAEEWFLEDPFALTVIENSDPLRNRAEFILEDIKKVILLRRSS